MENIPTRAVRRRKEFYFVSNIGCSNFEQTMPKLRKKQRKRKWWMRYLRRGENWNNCIEWVAIGYPEGCSLPPNEPTNINSAHPFHGHFGHIPLWNNEHGYENTGWCNKNFFLAFALISFLCVCLSLFEMFSIFYFCWIQLWCIWYTFFKEHFFQDLCLLIYTYQKLSQ